MAIPRLVAARSVPLAPIGLLALALLPSLTGVLRLGGGVSPLPLVVHIVAAATYGVLGALQFAPTLRRRRWHAVAGRVLGPLGLVAAFTGMWLAATSDNRMPLMNGLRLLSGAAMAGCVVLGLVAVRDRDFVSHGAWMTRAYALGLAAGTQFFTVLPYVLLAETRREPVIALLMGAGWAINLAVAEWSVRRRRVGLVGWRPLGNGRPPVGRAGRGGTF